MSDLTKPEDISISLVIPTYNRADFLKETIESALKQTKAFEEIIVVDDGFTDNTLETLQVYSDRIRVISIVNQGVQIARNTGVAEAHGKYVTLCDSDDLLEEDFVETVSRRLRIDPQFDILYCNFIMFDQSKRTINKFSTAPSWFFDGAQSAGDFVSEIPDLYGRLIAFQPLFPTGSTMSKEFFQNIGGYNKAFNGIGSEDLEFTLRAVNSGRVSLLTRPLTRVRKHPGNDSRNSMRQLMGEALILEYALKNHALALNYSAEIQQSIERRRQASFDAAYAGRDFETAKELLALFSSSPMQLKFWLKRMVVALPSPFRELVWAGLARVVSAPQTGSAQSSATD